MLLSWMSLIPPLLVVTSAIISQDVIKSLLLGIVSALVITEGFSPFVLIKSFILKIYYTLDISFLFSQEKFLDASYIFIILFLFILGGIISMLKLSGAAYSYASWIKQHLSKKKWGEFSCMLFSLCFVIDDYFSCLAVGSVMQSVTDRFKIPRIKLALLANTMAAPLVVLFPISSWVAEIISQMKRAGIDESGSNVLLQADPFNLYIHIIPFMFYPIIVIGSLIIFVYFQKSWGVIQKHELIASKNGNLFGGNAPRINNNNIQSEKTKSTLIDFIFPLLSIFTIIFLAILYFGNASILGGQSSIVSALQDTNISAALFFGSLIGFIIGFSYLVFRKLISFSSIKAISHEGFFMMYSSSIVLILIWTFSSLLGSNLKTGEYLAYLMIGHVSAFWLPILFFLTACCMATSMGSSWGTIGILFPMAIPMIIAIQAGGAAATLENVTILIPLLGSIISGAVVGNHLAPISDTMLMSATSSGANHLDLISAQRQLTIPSVISTAICYAVYPLISASLPIAASILLILGMGIMLTVTIISTQRYFYP